MLLFFLTITADAQSDLFGAISIDTVEVVNHSYSSPLKGIAEGLLKWDMSSLETLPQILGSANPLNTVQMLPGVQTTSEYDAGLYVNGCSNAHNAIKINGVAVYNPTHLFGLNSVFITSHFDSFQFSSQNPMNQGSNRIGGYLNMTTPLPDSTQRKFSGEFSLGMISSQGTLRYQLGPHSDISISARSSYLDFLYGNWLKIDDMNLKYNFQDANLTYDIFHNDRHLVRLNSFVSSDHLGLYESGSLDSKVRWDNCLSSLEYAFTGNELSNSFVAYSTEYASRVGFAYNNRNIVSPSEISSLGFNESFSYRWLTVGVDYGRHHIEPQSPELSGFRKSSKSNVTQNSQEWGAFAHFSTNLNESLKLGATVKYVGYSLEEDITEHHADAMAEAEYETASGIYGLKAGRRHQFLNQTGFSSIGFPTEFWFSSSDLYKPQQSLFVQASHYIDFNKGMYSLKSELYFYRLDNQVEYVGNAYDLFDGNYNLNDCLKETEGYNYGINLMLNKQAGVMTGWISYSLGRAIRWFNDDRDYKFPSSHERVHELNCCANYKYDERWSFGTTFTLASGNPFTAPDYFYLMNGRIMTNFSKLNRNRLPAYKRLDISCLYRIPQKHDSKVSQSVNFSIYNVMWRKNVCMYRLKVHNSAYGYFPLSFIDFPLPSVNYMIKF
ncbi:MAG: hypothetical protein MJY58_05625 [Bacteroidaceae bacterium]|nr:hypothetical protein [Bacteroidaceae bacterium]